MRFLFSTIPGYGHLCPIIPLAQALVAAGHQVAFATSALMEAELAPLGFEVLPCGPAWKESDYYRNLPESEKRRFAVDGMAKFFTREYIPSATRDLDESVCRWKPDTIVSNDFDAAGRAIAEKYTIPFVLLTFGPRLSREARAQRYFRLFDLARKQVGLASDPSLSYTHHWLHLCFTPLRYRVSPAAYDEADNEFSVCPQIYDRFGDGEQVVPVPGAVSRGQGGITALCTLGTVFNTQPRLVENIIHGTAGLVDRLLVMLGPNLETSGFNSVPANVELHRALSLTETLPRVDYCITHGGASTVLSMLLAGKPMYLIPQGADQVINAAACARSELGVAGLRGLDSRSVAFQPGQTLSTQEIRDNFVRLISTPRYREQCVQMQTALREMPPITHAVDWMERLVRTGKPVTRAAIDS